MRQISEKRIAKAKQTGMVRKGTFIVSAKDLLKKEDAMSKKIKDQLFGLGKSGRDDQRKKAKDAADKWFSEWIRLRDAGPDGRVKCITCPHTDHWRYQQCGHFVTRGHASTRFNPKNANAQCRGCNYNGGQHLKHATAIDAKHGSGTADALELQGRQRCSRTTKQLWEIAEQFKADVMAIKAAHPEKYNSPTNTFQKP